MTRRLVVIGNGMAATRLVQRLVERDPARFAITVVGDEPQHFILQMQMLKSPGTRGILDRIMPVYLRRYFETPSLRA